MLRKSPFIVCAAVVLSALVLGTAAAQDSNWNQRTYFTFSAPFELPGKTLPAGTYLFRLLDSPSNRHVVQVFDKDEKEILATVLAIPAQRVQPSDEPEVRFMEVAANQPPAIRTWWFPARTIGHEFIYPKEQAMRLARGANSSVLTVTSDANTTETMREAELARINEGGQTAQVSAGTQAREVSGRRIAGRTKVTTPPPAESEATTVPQRTAVTQRPVETTTAAPPTSTESVRTTRTALPHTGSYVPLLVVLGLGSLMGAAALRVRRRANR
jgi:LPXTG-motif cell wall-anchored protein